MAAHMQRIIRISGVKFEKSRITRREYAFSHNLTSRYFSTGADSSSSLTKSSQTSEDIPQDSPNQTNVMPSADFRNFKKLPNLINNALQDENSNHTFAKLLRDSNFAHLGSPRGKVVYGTIYRVVGDDLYVDFDWKFPCVVKRPTQDAHLYVNNAIVRLRILDLEMSTIFLGAEKETSLNEANCYLVGLESSPLGTPQKKQSFVN